MTSRRILIHGVETTPEEFWKSLPERDAILLEKHGPLVAEQWRSVRPVTRTAAHYWIREDLQGKCVAECIQSGSVWLWTAEYIEASERTANSLAEAQAAADAHLRANGWLLESEVST